MSDIDGAAHKVKLTEAYLKVRKVKVSPSVSIAHELALKKGPAIYPVRCVECKTFIIPTGNPSLRKDNLGITVNGEVPFKPLQLSYTDATIRYIEAYLSMFSGTGKLFYDTGNGISCDDLKNGYWFARL